MGKFVTLTIPKSSEGQDSQFQFVKNLQNAFNKGNDITVDFRNVSATPIIGVWADTPTFISFVTNYLPVERTRAMTPTTHWALFEFTVKFPLNLDND